MNQPPGSGKSINALVIFPAWCYAHNPAERILSPSFDFKHVCKLSTDSKNLINTEWYQAFFGDTVQVDPHVNRQDEWQTTAGGWRIATTPRGRATGKHPTMVLCFPGSVKIETDKGSVPIGDIADNPDGYQVRTHRHRYQPIMRVFRNHARELVEIKHETGILRCTRNHPVWVVDRGWARADQIKEGDDLQLLREDVRTQPKEEVLQRSLSTGSPPESERQDTGVSRVWEDVQQTNEAVALLDGVQEQSSNPNGNSPVRPLWQSILQTTGPPLAGQVKLLQPEVCSRVDQRHIAPLRQTGKSADLRELRERVLRRLAGDQAARHGVQRLLPGSSGKDETAKDGLSCVQPVPPVPDVVPILPARAGPDLLHNQVCRHSPLQANDSGGQQQLHARTSVREVPERVQEGAGGRDREGREPVPVVQPHASRIRQGMGRPSHRLQQGKQRDGEPDHALSVLPRENAWQGTVSRAVAVQVIEADCPVFNIEVAVDHTYWADGVLAHNCDDPTNVRQADSSERENVNHWWSRTMSSRGAGSHLNRRRLVVMQRLHEEDLAGHIIKNDDWARCSIPMEYEKETSITVPGLLGDPRTKEGELLWPEMFPAKRVEELKRDLGEDYYGQYQQRPVAAGGALFKIDRITMVEADEVPHGKISRYKRAWDRAATRQGGCFTAGILCGIVEGENGGQEIYVIDVIRKQWDIAEVEAQLKVWATVDEARYGRAKYETVIEEEGGSAGKHSAYETGRNTRGLRVRTVPTGGDPKRIRWDNLRKSVYRYEVHVVQAPWTQEFIRELATVPRSQFKDQVDSVSLAYNELIKPGFFDLPDDEGEGDDPLQSGENACKNRLCNRLSREGDDYCCDCCKVIDVTGQDIREIADAHGQSCNFRHGELRRRGLWESGEV